MRKKMLAILAAAAMFAAAAPAYVSACENNSNAKGSYGTGLEHKNSHALANTNNGIPSDVYSDATSRTDVDSDSARDAHAKKLPPGWAQGGDWSSSSSTSTTTTTTTTTSPAMR